MHKVSVLSRHIDSWELADILERMPAGKAICVPEVHKWDSVWRLRNMVYYMNSKNRGVSKWKTHWRLEGFFIERWR